MSKTYLNISKINKKKEYSLKEIVANAMIPHIDKFSDIYDLISEKNINKTGKKRNLFLETTKTRIKAIETGKPFKKICGKIFVIGKEIIKFRNLNSLI